VHQESLYPGLVNDPYGGLELERSGYLDVKELLNAYRDKLNDLGSYENTIFREGDLTINGSEFVWNDRSFRNIVFCDGIASNENRFFHWLPYQPLKGEILTVRMNANFKHIINRGVFVLEKEPSEFVVGSTYNWREPWTDITEEGKRDLLDRLGMLIHGEFEVIGHKAGVRPSTKDRRPIMGAHPEIKNMWIFNGLGTKGVTLAPFFAKQFRDYLVEDKVLDPLVNINRFYSLYFHSSSSSKTQ
jgi:glycine/D-amino acid oxidase-like deaminating enzyme